MKPPGTEIDGRPVWFVGEVVPILTRHGCNAGGCHGKSGGQNGFRLSLLGSDPSLEPLKRVLIERTEGTPLFLEESVRMTRPFKILVADDEKPVAAGLQGQLDAMGHRYSGAMRLTERYTRRSTGRMEAQFTIDDPETFTKPITVSMAMVLRADTDLIVLGAPSPQERAMAWWRSVASSVTANAPCSVHVVRRPL